MVLDVVVVLDVLVVAVPTRTVTGYIGHLLIQTSLWMTTPLRVTTRVVLSDLPCWPLSLTLVLPSSMDGSATLTVSCATAL